MPRRACLIFLAALAVPAFGQLPVRIPPETVEPPLADGSNPIQPVGAIEPRALPAPVRTLDAPAPVVQLRVVAPTVAAAGRDLDLKFVVENLSRVPALGVTVQYVLPTGAAYSHATPPPDGSPTTECVWKLDTLAAAGRKEIALTVKLPAEATDLEHRARVYLAHDQTARTRLAKPGLAIRKTGPDVAQQHDILIFGLEVTNTGGVDLTDVQVTDELPAGLEHRLDPDKPPTYAQPQATVTEPGKRMWTIGRLPAGQTRRIEYHVHARQTGVIQHGGYATAAGGGVRAEATPVKVTIRELQLELTANAPPREAATRPVRVQVTLRNLSRRQLDNIVITDRLLDACQLDAISAGGQLFDKQVQWIVQSLRPNETRTLELVLRRAAGGAVRHQVSAVYRGLTKTVEAATEFDATAALQWDLRGSTPTVEVNGEVAYTLTVRNVGAGPATNVRPTVTLPPELVYLKAQPLMHKADGQRVVFEPVTLPADGSATFQIQARAVRAAVAARVEAELAADVYTTGPVKRTEVTAIGGGAPRP
jgi:uncharacterized repeat protein (TIGR01451 family)